MKRNISQEKLEQKRAQQRKGELSREEIKAKKHQQTIAYERKRSPEVMWNTLLDGQTFANYSMKKLVL